MTLTTATPIVNHYHLLFQLTTRVKDGRPALAISSEILDMSLFIKKKKNQIFFSLISHLCDLVGKGSSHTPNCDVFDLAVVPNNSLSTLNLVSHHIHEGPVP